MARSAPLPRLPLLCLLLLLFLVHSTSSLPAGLTSTEVRIPIKINRQTFSAPQPTPHQSAPPSASPSPPSPSPPPESPLSPAAPEPTYIPSLVLPVPNITASPSPPFPPRLPLTPSAWSSLSSLLSSCFYHRTPTEPFYVYTLCPFHNLTQTKLTWGVAQAVTAVGVWSGWDEEASTSTSLVQSFDQGEPCLTHAGAQPRQARLHLRCASAEAVAAMGSPLTFTPPSASAEPSLTAPGPLGYVSAVVELRRCDYTAWLYTPAACPALPPSLIPPAFNLTRSQSSPLPLYLAPVHLQDGGVDEGALLDCIRRLRADSADPCAAQWNAVRAALPPIDTTEEEEEGQRGEPYPYQHEVL